MRARLRARSISRSVKDLLQGSFGGCVLAVFEHACDLVTLGGDVIALVTPSAGDGPLNIVLNLPAATPARAGAAPWFLPVEGESSSIEPGVPAVLEEGRLRVGGLEVTLEGAAVWEPCPDWAALRSRRDAVANLLPWLWTVVLHQAPPESLVPLAAGWIGSPPAAGRAGAALGRISRPAVARPAAEMLRDGWTGDLARLREGAAKLAGVGIGLTPAGDDFLGGTMLWARMAHPSPHSFCHALVEEAAPRTTTLSAALLRAAARGECSAAWHRLLGALGRCAGSELSTGLFHAVQGLLAQGATSGADALAGFLWVASNTDA